MKLNSINHTFNQSSLKRNRQAQNTSFGALYFKNNKVREKAMKNPVFTNLIQFPAVAETIKNYNLLVENVKGKDVFFRACKDVVQEGNNLVATGFRGPVLSNAEIINSCKYYNLARGFFLFTKKIDLRKLLAETMENEKFYNKFSFKNEKTREDFLESLFAPILYQDSAIQKLLNKDYQIVVTNAKPKKIDFIASSDIIQDKNSVSPAGNLTYEHTLDKALLYKTCQDEMRDNEGYLFEINKNNEYFSDATLSAQLDRLQDYTENGCSKGKKLQQEIAEATEVADDV